MSLSSKGPPLLVVATLFSVFSPAVAQDAVPGEILSRTLLIKARSMFGTAFTIDHEGKLYIVTARHVVARLPEGKATIQVQRSSKWVDIDAVKTLFPDSKDVDIAVLEN